MVEFIGARYEDIDGEKVYEPIGPVAVNPKHVGFVCDHMIVVDGMKVKVMEPYKEILKRLKPFMGKFTLQPNGEVVYK